MVHESKMKLMQDWLFADYYIALARLSKLMDTTDPVEEKELSELANQIEAYEKIHYPIPEPTPEEAAEFRKEQETK